MFTKILIANRGEIACRVIKTCRRMGIRTVAVYSEADAHARHVRLADESICVGPAASRESYLVADHILQAAVKTGAQAVHPGYGFLSENERFAAACVEAGIVFIGPPVTAIRAMGSKSAAKALMASAGVPLVPGYHGDDQDANFLREQADSIGYPVLIKATAGGGGKGMRVVETSGDFVAALISCQREARASFGDDRVLIEKYLLQPKHIEIQIFGDNQGNVISLFERDCSAQRRHQKVIEEAPAPSIDEAQRAVMGQAACNAARAVKYVGAGTVEFIADQGGSFYFMEMNTRLQVEHPVTEMITGLDLVEWQLRVAAGEPLPLQQPDLSIRGHSIEVRIYAEEPEKGFLPSIGRLAHFKLPPESRYVRVDTGVEQGDEVSPFYDPMLSKLIVWDESRAQAIERMLVALGQFQIAGVGNNIAFLSRLIDHPIFRAGEVDTGVIERERAVLIPPQASTPPLIYMIGALSALHQEAEASRVSTRKTLDPNSPWSITDGWRINGHQDRRLTFLPRDEGHAPMVSYRTTGLHLNNQPAEVQISADGEQIFVIGDVACKAKVVCLGNTLHVYLPGQHHQIIRVDSLAVASAEPDAHAGLTAPMPGKIIALCAEVGTLVDRGAPLVVMEAMKMEHTLCAPAKGRVRSYLARIGEQVKDGVDLVEFEADKPGD